jgi:hypothetical protein
LADYSFLRPIFFQFLRDKEGEADNWQDEIDPQMESIRRPSGDIDPYYARQFGFDFETDREGSGLFASHVMDGWKQLSEAQIRGVLWEISFYLGRIKGLRLRVEPLEHPKAIDWLWIDAHLLGLSNFRLFMTDQEKLDAFPWGDEYQVTINDRSSYAKTWGDFIHRQCPCCGKIAWEGSTSDKPPKTARWCHLECCDTSNPSLDNHPKGCCFGDRAREREAFKRRLDRALKKSQSAANAVFLNYLDEKFEENKKKPESLRCWADWKIHESIKNIIHSR